MNFTILNERHTLDENSNLSKKYGQFAALLEELNNKELPIHIVDSVNEFIYLVNKASDDDLKKQLRKSQSKIVYLLEKEVKIVVKNHYRNTWMVLGISIGVGIGTAIGAGAQNMGLMSTGIPIGMVIGLAVGTQMDKKAKEEGRQLNIELKH